MKKKIAALLDHLYPGSRLLDFQDLEGSYSNTTFLVEALQADGSPLRVVTRRYSAFGDYDLAQKAAREFKTLKLVKEHGIPAPQPLYLDQKGEYLGSPGIFTSFMPGTLVASPPDPLSWANEMARILAQIHAVPYKPAMRKFLLDANQEATWFLRQEVTQPGIPPDFMQAHPLGASVWQAVHDHFERLQPTPPGLVHIDYWPGNILWENGRISGVVDWEEAAYGDPAIDVAYCRMNMVLEDLDEAAAEFLHTYEIETGRPIANLAFWELAASARPMFAADDWHINEAPYQECFRRFIETALADCSFWR
jgi:aminoglycoside phosphotransferase (APT) family kinase protein